MSLINSKYCMKNWILTVVALATVPSCVSGAAMTKPIEQEANGRLKYNPDADGNIVPDYSHAGYKGGGVALPNVPVKLTVEPQEGDDTAIIKAAIEKMGALPLDANGFRGAILLKRGRYDISDTIRIPHSGIVIRGEGAGKAGTYIVHGGAVKQDSFWIESGTLTTEKKHQITSPYVAVGSKRIQLESVADLKVGQTIQVRSNQTQKWIDALKLTEAWKASDFSFKWMRNIVSIDTKSKEVLLDAPITSQIDLKNGYATAEIETVVKDERVNNVGFEDLLLMSEYNPASKDPYGYFNDEEHARRGINFRNATNCWVRGVAGFFYSFSLVWVRGESSRITIEDCAMLDGVSLDTPRVHKGARKYYFNLGGSETLVQRCFSRYGRHSYAMGGYNSGNVFLDCYSEKGHLGQEPHQRWQHGSLFDNVFSDSMLKLNRSDGVKDAHGQRAANCMLWNCVSASTRTGDPEILLDKPLNNLGQNWAIGNIIRGKGKGMASPGPETQNAEAGYIESANQPVQPRSLYIAQLNDRLGPQAVANVTVPQQLQKSWKIEDNWRKQFDQIPHFSSSQDLTWLPDMIRFEGRAAN
jgi:hypothetical protein